MKNKLYWSGHKLYHEPAALMCTLRQVHERLSVTCLGREHWIKAIGREDARRQAEAWLITVLLELIDDIGRLGSELGTDASDPDGTAEGGDGGA